jgi:excisionase family DNA binding protein
MRDWTGSSVTELLKVPEAAQILAASKTKVYEWIASGELESVKLGPGRNASRRIPRDALEEFIARLRDGHQPAGVSRRRLPRRSS